MIIEQFSSCFRIFLQIRTVQKCISKTKMQREEKVLEAATDAIIQRATELKNAITQTIMRLEMEGDQLKWPALLDNFGLLTSELSSVLKAIKNEKCPALRNYAVLPLALNPEKDEDLLRMTEGRIPFFNHEVVPHALRTKPEPTVEQYQQQLEQRMNQGNADMMQKQINTMNKIVGHIMEAINNHTQEREAGMPAPAQTFNMNDTHLLIAAVAAGRGLKPNIPMPQPPPQQMGGQRPMGMMGQVPMNKMPNIRANIRVAGAPQYSSR